MSGASEDRSGDRFLGGVRSKLSRVLWRTGHELHHAPDRLLRRAPNGSFRHGDRSLPLPVRPAEPCVAPSSNEPAIETPAPPADLYPVGSNPVLTADDATDYGRTDGVADPFLLVIDGEWHLFFEVANRNRTPTAVIGHATSPDAGCNWTYDRVVLETDVHLSFPYVFRYDDRYYMLPDAWSQSGDPADVTLFRTDRLPDGWDPVATIAAPKRPVHDCVLFRRDGRWWALGGAEGAVFAYYSDRLETDRWRPHSENPVVEGRPRAARPGGRPFVENGRVFVYFQDCTAQYGKQVRLYEITALSPTAYADREYAVDPVLGAAPVRLGWNAGKMHHVDYVPIGDRWRCLVDGNVGIGRSVFGDDWAIGVYEAPIGDLARDDGADRSRRSARRRPSHAHYSTE